MCSASFDVGLFRIPETEILQAKLRYIKYERKSKKRTWQTTEIAKPQETDAVQLKTDVNAIDASNG